VLVHRFDPAVRRHRGPPQVTAIVGVPPCIAWSLLPDAGEALAPVRLWSWRRRSIGRPARFTATCQPDLQVRVDRDGPGGHLDAGEPDAEGGSIGRAIPGVECGRRRRRPRRWSSPWTSQAHVDDEVNDEVDVASPDSPGGDPGEIASAGQTSSPVLA
jgi:hypothetical protein